MRAQHEAGTPRRGFIIFDDCITGKQWKSDAFLDLATQVRHYKITVIMSTQYPNKIPPSFRDTVWKVFMFKSRGGNSVIALHNAFGQVFASRAEFTRFYLTAVGEKHQFIVYDAEGDGTTVVSLYQIMRCPKTIPKFFIGPKRD